MIPAYANDAGDLFIHDRWTYQQELDVDGFRPYKAACPEEFVVYAMGHLKDTTTGDPLYHEILSSLALDPDIKDIVGEAFYNAAIGARTAHSTPPAPPPAPIDTPLPPFNASDVYPGTMA